jgi:arylsulfatase A-like enzyme
MVVRLNQQALDHAKHLITDGRFIADKRDAWSEHQPSAAAENDFIRLHGYDEFGKWHLGIDDEKRPQTKGRYEFPYGDFVDVHRCAVLSAESRAGQYKHHDIENAVAHLHGMIDAIGMRTRDG